MSTPSNHQPPTTVGTDLPPRQFAPVTTTDIVRYQGASGDMNPMHHDDALARQAGYREAFGVGMMGAGYLAAFCTGIYGTETVRRIRTRFKELVWRGDTLTATGRVARLFTVAGERRVTVELALTTDTGTVVIEGSADFTVS
jgi:acyl dehydratase